MKEFELPKMLESELSALSQILEDYIRSESNQGRARVASLKTAPILLKINQAKEVKAVKNEEV